MTLTSPWYLLFLAAVVFICARVPHARGRQTLVLAASWVFYASFGVGFLPILWLSILFGWWTIRKIATHEGVARRRWLVASVCGSLAVLASFKYGPHAARALNHLLGAVDLELDPDKFRFRFPLGISFYVFESISYAVDVYRGKVDAPSRLRSYATFISFFPHLLAGPIVRAGRLVPQLEGLPQRATPSQRARGVELIITGLFRKLVLGDQLLTLAATIPTATAGQHFVALQALGLALTLAGVYCDFAGYTDLARGSAKLLGVELPINFRQPLTRSRGFGDFWTRYNVTLMMWFRDYVYQPVRALLGGRRQSWIAVIVLFALSGLWHDAALRWILWGLAVGSVIALERARARRSAHRGRTTTAPRIWTTVGRPLAVDLGMIAVLIGITLINAAISPPSEAARAAASFRGPSVIPTVIMVLTLLGGLVAFDLAEPGLERNDGRRDYSRARTVGIAALVVAIAVFGGVARPFTYFSV